MRYSIKVFLIICVLSTLSFPQRKQYFDAPFGVGGGYSPGWFFPKMDLINQKLKSFGVPDLSSNGFYTSGGSGFAYLGFIPYLRVGGMGYAGSTSKSSEVDGTNREVIYSLGGGGLTIEYTMPFVKNVGISVGGIIGAGSLSIELYRNSGSFNWDDVWNEISNASLSAQNISRTIKNNFWFFSPMLNVDIPVYRFVSVRFGFGYQLTFSDSWKVENDKELSNVPSNLNGNSFFIQSGIFIGFFSF